NTLLKSIDAGVSWTPIGPVAGADGRVLVATVFALAVSPTDPMRLWLGTGVGVFRTVDGGATWQQSLVGTGVPYLVVDPSNPLIVYATMPGPAVQKSVDGGATWTPANNGLGSGVSFPNPLAIDPVTPTVLYLSVDGYGVFKTTDGAANWSYSGG